MQSILRTSSDDATWRPWFFLSIAVLALAVVVSIAAVTAVACGGSGGNQQLSPTIPDATATETEETATATSTRTATATATETERATATPTEEPEGTPDSGPSAGPDYVDDSAEVACTVGAPLSMNTRVSRDCVIGPLVSVEGGYSLNADAAEAYLAMRDAAAADGITIYIVSAYRSFETQWELYWAEVASSGPNQNTSAKPGHSEHQLGTTVDLNDLSSSFGDTPEGLWLQENAGRFGFQMSYPPGNPQGYAYEPWHWRWWGN